MQDYSLTCAGDAAFPLDDPMVRQALTLAVDKQDIINRHYEGEGSSTPTYMIPFIGWAYNNDPALQEYIAYDVDKANQLLDDAGYPRSFVAEDPFGGQLELRFDGWDLRVLVGNHDTKRYQSAITLCQYWTEIGIRCHVVTTSFNLILLDVYDTGEFETYVGGYSVGVDPDWFWQLLNADNAYRVPNNDLADDGDNSGQWLNDEFTELGREARSTTDLVVRAEKYKRMQEIVAMEQPGYNYYVSPTWHAREGTVFGGFRPGTGLGGPWDENALQYIHLGDTPQYGGEIFVGTSDDPDSLNPYLYQTLFAAYFVEPMFDSLLALDEDNNLYPQLAKEIPVGKIEGDVWTTTFELRDGIKWHDGTPLTAEDIVFSYDLAVSDSTLDVWDNLDYDVDPETQEVTVTALDDKTVKFDVQLDGEPYVYAAFYLYAATMDILPKHLLGDSPDWKTDDWNKAPVGSGPFMFDSGEAGKFWRLVKNPDYYLEEDGKQLPYLDAVTLKYYSSSEAMTAGFLGGEIDVHGFQLSPKEREDIQSEADKLGMAIIFSERPDNGFRYVNYNTKSQCLPDPIALQMAGVVTTTEPVTATETAVVTVTAVPEFHGLMTALLVLSMGVPVIILRRKLIKS
jgi:ABC-type transport system substrate-binding protein